MTQTLGSIDTAGLPVDLTKRLGEHVERLHREVAGRPPVLGADLLHYEVLVQEPSGATTRFTVIDEAVDGDAALTELRALLELLQRAGPT